jgi:hypothetical protein
MIYDVSAPMVNWDRPLETILSPLPDPTGTITKTVPWSKTIIPTLPKWPLPPTPPIIPQNTEPPRTDTCDDPCLNDVKKMLDDWSGVGKGLLDGVKTALKAFGKIAIPVAVVAGLATFSQNLVPSRDYMTPEEEAFWASQNLPGWQEGD